MSNEHVPVEVVIIVVIALIILIGPSACMDAIVGAATGLTWFGQWIRTSIRRRRDPVLNSIMVKAPELSLSNALKLVGTAKALKDTHGDFQVVYHPPIPLGTYTTSLTTDNEGTKEVEVEDYSQPSWTVEAPGAKE